MLNTAVEDLSNSSPPSEETWRLQVSDLEAANAELEDTNTQLEAVIVQATAAKDGLQSQLEAQHASAGRLRATEAELETTKADATRLQVQQSASMTMTMTTSST